MIEMIGVYDYTVILTYASLLSGCLGLIVSMSGMGHPYYGMIFMMFSGLCDGFDGMVARTKKNRTELEKSFGAQIDSFADLISFGVLPAMIGISLLRVSPFFHDVPHRSDDTGKLIWYPAVLVIVAITYVLTAMIRLAYFNATENERIAERQESGTEYFRGLPVTSSAWIFPIVLMTNYIFKYDFSIVYFIVMAVLAVLFVTNIKIKKPGKKMLYLYVGIGLTEIIILTTMHLLRR